MPARPSNAKPERLTALQGVEKVPIGELAPDIDSIREPNEFSNRDTTIERVEEIYIESLQVVTIRTRAQQMDTETIQKEEVRPRKRGARLPTAKPPVAPGAKGERDSPAASPEPLEAASPIREVADSFVPGTPVYSPEFCGVGGKGPISDELGVNELARRLAELIALRDTKLPLAVGLFGDWGSGKSHFMNLMDRHMKLLATGNRHPSQLFRTKDAGYGAWCTQIVPIYFNAWHYSDSNLWASLVTEVFDKLFEHLRPERNELELLQSQLRDAGGVTALAAEEVRGAGEDVQKAATALEEASAQKERAKQVLESLLSGLRTLVPELNSAENQQRVLDLLGVSVEAATLSELTAKLNDLKSIGGRARELWRRATAPEGLVSRLAWLAGALMVVLVGRIILPMLSPEIRALMSSAHPWVKTLLALLSGAMGWMIPVIGQVRKGLSQLEVWEKKAETARVSIPEDPRIVKATNAMSRAKERAAAAEVALESARSRERQLTRVLNELHPERRLSSFIETRARSADYRGQLGLVSLARKDFAELSTIFTDSKALRERINAAPEKAQGLTNLSASIDRVVLFIDDLDRCEPEKVVDVLQAVHLLLAFPLFAVIVGVDQRCLKQSLRIRFKGLVTPIQESINGAEEPREDDGIPATPLDYLEKIFHIPFHLPPMSEQGFATLIAKLTEPVPSFELPATQATSEEPDGELHSTEQQPEIQETGATPSQKEDGITDVRQSSASVPEVTSAQSSSPPVVGSVSLYQWERKALTEYHSVIHTPRAATRFLNTYRLVRAGVPSEEWNTFRGGDGGQKEFRIAMLLLAVAAGQPAVARDWFTLLRRSNLDGLPLEKNGSAGKHTEWENFRKLYDRTLEQVRNPLPTQLLTKWLDRVERFAF